MAGPNRIHKNCWWLSERAERLNALEKLPSSPRRKKDDENWARRPIRPRSQIMASERRVSRVPPLSRCWRCGPWRAKACRCTGRWRDSRASSGRAARAERAEGRHVPQSLPNAEGSAFGPWSDSRYSLCKLDYRLHLLLLSQTMSAQNDVPLRTVTIFVKLERTRD